MLKIDINEKETSIEGQGSVYELLSDITFVIKVIYNGLEKEEVKEDFEYGLKKMIEEKLYQKTAEDLMKDIEKRNKENKEKQDKLRKELSDLLDELKGML